MVPWPLDDLTEAVVKAMLLSKLKILSALVLAVVAALLLYTPLGRQLWQGAGDSGVALIGGPFHLTDHRHAVADGGANVNVGIPMAEDRQQSRKQMLAGDGTCRQEQFSGERCRPAGHIAPRVFMKVENVLGILVELSARVGKQDPAAAPMK